MSKEYTFQGNTFVIENYAEKPAFTNFLPGIAGLDGRPLWAFYVNRGQGIAGFGVHGKDSPIMEFFPAQIAYQIAPRQGFRTFLKIDGHCCEPLAVGAKAPSRMEIRRRGFAVEERGDAYLFRAEYFGVPSEDYAALARVVTYTNTSDAVQNVSLLDGLAEILPYGITNSAFKEVGNLFKSWMCVEGLQNGYCFYKMRSSTDDSAEVSEVKGGNFFLSRCDLATARPVVDPKTVFGEDYTKTYPSAFEKSEDALHGEQNTENEFFCAFAHCTFALAPNETVTLTELFGYADSEERVKALNDRFTVEYVLQKRGQAEAEAEKIADRVRTRTANPLFDEYIRQCYFDNVLRGGMPVELGGKTYYVYSRKHGDPERDYNAFVIEPQPYSCGNGNFRDVAQNRRNDIFITPECGDFNIAYFFSLLQLDGYNPLSLFGVKFHCGKIPAKYRAHEAFLRGEFTVGELCKELGTTDRDVLAEIVREAEPLYKAKFSEGYWTDHFVYLIDLVTAYLGVYPDRAERLLFETPLRWFRSGAQVLPRSEKTILRKDGAVRRLGSVEERGADGWERTADGKEFTTSLAAKLLHLIAIKLATLDPLGCGIDMEADKPGWCDATNGLPSVFGSNVADAIELKRLVKIFARLMQGGPKIVWSREQDVFFREMYRLLRTSTPQEFYEESNRSKEAFRAAAYGGLSGETAAVSSQDVSAFLSLAEARLQEGLQRAKELADGWYPTYLRFEVTEWEPIAENGQEKFRGGSPCVRAKKFRAYALPHFAEGAAKGLAAGERELYAKVKQSGLRDRALGVYLSSEPLDGESMEIGRIRSFPKGWLERESCFLHMNYKLMLSLLQAGLYREFYEEIKTNLVPFMDPSVYGRSTLENSSFLATTNHPDKGNRGRGFQARLTGANAEVLSMWRMMMGLERPFTMKNGELRFELRPILHRDLFQEDEVSFLLFGRTEVVYRNPNGKNTYDADARITAYRLTGGEIDATVSEVTGELAEGVRTGKITKIEVTIE